MPASRSDQNITFQLPRNALKIAGIAFCVGLLLFVVVWLNARRHNDFYRADPAQPQVQADEAMPLPEPLPAGTGASDMPDARPEAPAEETPQVVETAPAPPLPETPVAAAPATPVAPSPTVAAPSDRPATAGPEPAPVLSAGCAAAWRKRHRGGAGRRRRRPPGDRRSSSGGCRGDPDPVRRLRCGVAKAAPWWCGSTRRGGLPLDAKIIQRSGSRDLDRAALDAVRGWRFQPAQSNGQPMVGSLEIPFDFQPAQ